ncbi:MAG: DUF473 family protein [Methermicoccaceae archaeon]
MKYIALTGITQKAIDEMVRRGLKTFEICSPHNFIAILNVDVGDTVFITPIAPEDIIPGTRGVLANVEKKSIYYQKSYQQTAHSSEETEHLSAKLQLRAREYSIIRDVQSATLDRPIMVEVKKISYFDAF